MDKEENNKFEEFKRVVRSSGETHFALKYNDGRVAQKRLFVSQGCLCEFKKGSRSTGHIIDPYHVSKIVSIIPKSENKTSIEKLFSRNCDRVISMLSDSGLWENILSYVKFMNELGYDKTNLAYEKYFDCRFLPGENLADRDERRKKDVREISDGFFFIDKKSGEEACFLSDWVSSFWSERGIKKMYFGRQNNEWVLGRIKSAFKDKESYSSCKYYNGNYDASFEYNPELKMAWYSEEFKGCANGYYYFALNETHALFIEKD